MGNVLTYVRLAVRFLLGLKRDTTPVVKSEIATWQLAGKTVEARIYWPETNKPLLGTVLAVHGMNCLGATDPRLVQCCQVLASLGFICVAPTIQSITQHLILTDQAVEIRRVMQHVLADKHLCPSGRLGVFTASFSGALSIIAAADKSIRDCIQAILSIGIYHDSAATILDLLSNDCNDLFARCVCLKNIYRLSGQFDPVIDQALECAILDDFAYIPDGHVDAYVETLSSADKQRVTEMLTALKNRCYTPPPELMAKFDPHAFRHGFDFVHLLPDLPFRLYVLHSEADQIMYAYHARDLQKHIKHSKLHHRVLITPLLDHADTQINGKQIIGIFRAVTFLAAYFHDLQRPLPKQ